MQGRRVLEKHKHFALYHPSAFYIATVIADIPLALIQVIIFEICVYFMMGLQLEAGRVSTRNCAIVVFGTNALLVLHLFYCACHD